MSDMDGGPHPPSEPSGAAEAPPVPPVLLPPPPDAPRRRSRVPLIGGIAVGVIALIVVASWLGQTHQSRTTLAAGPSAPAASSSSDGSTDPTGLPPSIGGAPLIEGEIANAFKNLMNAYAGQGVAESGVYGSAERPEYMYLVINTDPVPGLSGEAFLKATSKATGFPIEGGFVEGNNGAIHVTCAPFESPGLTSMCYIASEGQPAMAMAFHADPEQALEDLLEAPA